MSSRRWITVGMLGAFTALACRETGRVDAATLEHAPSGILLHVAVLGDAKDIRLGGVREAIRHWNEELSKIGRHVQLDSGVVDSRTISDGLLRDAGEQVMFGVGPSLSKLRDSLERVKGDVVIVLSTSDLISYGLPWQRRSPGLVVLRRADIPPLTLPNTLRNVIAHEIGHALGLSHNGDPATLMCGRPASCRPAAFASEHARFFPLTSTDEAFLRERWP